VLADHTLALIFLSQVVHVHTQSPPMTGWSERCTSNLVVIQFRICSCHVLKEAEPEEEQEEAFPVTQPDV